MLLHASRQSVLVCSCRHRQVTRRARPQRVTAGLGLLEGAGRLLEVATVAGIGTGIVNSLRSYSPASPRAPDPEPDSDGVQWGVMSLVSFFPWFNGLACP